MNDVKNYPPYLDYPKPYKVQTNADRIRSMNDEELAKNMSDWQCWGGGLNPEKWLEWLQQPAE